MRVQHSIYGQGTIVGTNGDQTTVLFDSGVTKDVKSEDLLEVLTGI